MFQIENTEDCIVAMLRDVVKDNDWTLVRLQEEGFCPGCYKHHWSLLSVVKARGKKSLS
jgi:hypothetical protein